MKLIIAGLHLKKFPETEKYAREKVAKLEKFYPNIEEINVRLIWEQAHRDKNQDYTCEITIHVPGHILEIRDTESNMDKAIDTAVDRMQRIMVKEKEKHIERNRRRSVLSKIRNRFGL